MSETKVLDTTITEQHRDCADMPLASIPQRPKDTKVQVRVSFEMRDMLNRVVSKKEQSVSDYLLKLALQDPAMHDEWALVREERKKEREEEYGRF